MSGIKREQAYPHLFSPMIVKGKRFRNRIITAPTHHAIGVDEGDNNLNKWGVKIWGDRAKGGAAAVTIGEGRLDKLNSCAHSTHVNCCDDSALQKLHFFTDYVHTYGALASMEFNHSGQFSMPQFNPQGLGPMGASAMTMPNGLHVKEMDESDMKQVAESYAKASLMAKRAGFDIVLLHFAHGWLMGGFLSPLINKRTDQYGGSIENRCRFPLMVLQHVREAVGDDFIIECRIGGDEMTPGGIVIEDTIEMLKIFEPYIDMAHISCGTRYNAVTRAIMNPSHFITEHAHIKNLARQAKESGIKIPIGTVGAVTDPQLCDEMIANGDCDYVVMARSVIADPNWANKARAGKTEDIRPCIRCFRCLDIAIGRVNTSTKAVLDDFKNSTKKCECSVNPLFGHGSWKDNYPAATSKKKIVVIGGGPGGMQAALEAAERGHDVVLFEKEEKLGGQLFYADYVWFKKDMKRYREYLIHQVDKAKIDVRLGIQATPKIVAMEYPDTVIVAVGADPLIPPIPGVDHDNVITAVDMYGHEELVGDKVVIIGGGMVGCETALHLTSKGKTVELVEMGEMLAPDGIFTERIHTLDYMDKDEHLSYYVETTCVAIQDNGVVVKDAQGNQRTLQADTVVLAVGMESRNEERDQYKNIAFDVINIGDCVKPRNVHDAVAEGFNAALIQ